MTTSNTWACLRRPPAWMEALAVFARIQAGEPTFAYDRDHFKRLSVWTLATRAEYAAEVARFGERVVVWWYCDYAVRDANGVEVDAPDDVDTLESAGIPASVQWKYQGKRGELK